MKKIKLLATMIVVGVFLCLYSLRYVNLNNKYPPPHVQQYEERQSVPYDSFELTVLETTFMNQETLDATFQDEHSAGVYPKCIVIDLKIYNNSQSEKQIEIYPFVLESGAWSNGIHLAAFLALNADVDQATLTPTLQPGESCMLKLPFTLTQEQFKPSQWKNIENRDFQLTFSLYPEKKTILL